MKLHLNDKIQFLRKLTLKKLFNALKIYTSFYQSKYTSNVQSKGFPFSIAIEPTTSCNLRCPECPSGLRSFTRNTGSLQSDLFQSVIDEMSDYLMNLTFYFQGEPYLNPQFLNMVRYAHQKGIYTSTSTNAHYLDDAKAKETIESGLDRIIVSIDGTTQDVYEQYRVGGKLDKVLEGTKNLLKWKKTLNSKTPHVIFQFLVVGPNEHQIEDVKKMAEEIGVDELKFKTAQIYNFQQGSSLIPTNIKYSRYKQNKGGEFELKYNIEDSCWKMWHSCVLTWDGKVVPCCFDKDAEFVLGKVGEKGLKDIWHNDRYTDFRKRLFRSRTEIEICKNCSEGSNVWI